MFLLANRMPVIFPLHMTASALALILLPLMIATRHKRHLHRPLGRALGVFVALGGLTALPVAIDIFGPALTDSESGITPEDAGLDKAGTTYAFTVGYLGRFGSGGGGAY